MIGVVGYLCEDFFPELHEAFAFVPGKLQEIAALPGCPGGSVGNTGGALCMLKVPVRLGVMTSDDAVGMVLRSTMESYAPEGGAFHLTIPGKASGSTLVLNPPGQDRMFFCCRGVNDLMTAESYPESFYEGLSLLHFGYPSLSLNMAQNGGEETAKLFTKSRGKGILTSLDLSLPAKDTPFYNMDWMAFFRKVLPLTDFFCPSIDELQCMLRDETSAPEELAKKAIAMGCGAVLLKMGGKGLLVVTSDSESFAAKMAKRGTGAWRNCQCFVPPEKITVINATGAGDTAIAGFLAGVDSGLDAATSAKIASKTAVSRITSPKGIWGIPAFKQIVSQL